MYDPGTADDWTSAIRAAITDAVDLKERWSLPMILHKGINSPLSVTMHFVFPRWRGKSLSAGHTRKEA